MTRNQTILQPRHGSISAAGRLLAACSPRGLLCLLIQLYRWTISPAQLFLFGPGSGCRFTPTCSQYAIEAIQAHGPLMGGFLVGKRICRCHPWGNCGHDPVPQKLTPAETPSSPS